MSAPSRYQLIAALPFAVSFAAAAGPLDPLLDGAKVGLDLRYRYESVEQEGIDQRAQASTLRARLGATSGTLAGFSFAAELETVATVGPDDYNDTANGKTQFPVVADPVGSELDQAYIQFKDGDWQVRYGRQRLVLDNARFIGNVGFRQNEQTFDGTTAVVMLGGGALTAGYLHNANRVFGEDHPDPLRANTELRAPFVHYGVALGPGRLAVYGHWLEHVELVANSHRNLGIRYAGEAALGSADALGGLFDGKARFAVEFARQDAIEDGDPTIDQDYRLLEAGYGWERIGFRVGVETLGGDGTRGFQTPLATLHAFNGWADRFLVTPPGGLVDTYLKLDAKQGRWSGIVAVHDFEADAAEVDYGQEVDVAVSFAVDSRTTLRLEHADYSATTFADDTRIVWLTAEFKY